MLIPSIKLPDVQKIETISIPLPTAEIPSYPIMVVPPQDLRPPDGVESENHYTAETGIRNVEIPILNFKVPLPENEILITATSTAVVSVAATLTATAAFKWAVTAIKPILKTLIKKISGRKEKGNIKEA